MKSLIFFNGPEAQDDVVVHECQGLASLPRSKDGTIVDLVLGFGKDFDSGESPVWVRSGVICDDGSLGLGAELGIVVEGYALGEKGGVERDGVVGVAVVGSAEGFEEEVAKDDLV